MPRPLDPVHRAAWDAFVGAAISAESGGPAVLPTGDDVLRWAEIEDGRVIGAAVSTPAADGRFVRIFVAEPHRRRGIGSALLAAVRAAHPGAALTAVTTTGEAFAVRHGAAVRLRLLVMEQWLRAAPAPDREVEIWRDRVPEALASSLDTTYRSLADAPGADRQDLYRTRAGPGNELWIAGVVTGGEVVAFTEIEAGAGPEASQHNTVVRPAHRRRGLGLAVKLGLAAYLRIHRPHLTTVTTTVSATNTAMIGLNERAGYRTVRARLLLRVEGSAE